MDDATILERPTCSHCLAAKLNATKLDVVRAMQRIAGTLPMEMHTQEACRVCGSAHRPVYVAARP